MGAGRGAGERAAGLDGGKILAHHRGLLTSLWDAAVFCKQQLASRGRTRCTVLAKLGKCPHPEFGHVLEALDAQKLVRRDVSRFYHEPQALSAHLHLTWHLRERPRLKEPAGPVDRANPRTPMI